MGWKDWLAIGAAPLTGGASLAFMGDDGKRTLNSLPIVGAVSESIFGNPDEEAHLKKMKQAETQLNQARPAMMQSRMNAVNNMSGAFEPMNNMMQQAYGGGNMPSHGGSGMFDLERMRQNPMSMGQQSQMNAKAFGQASPMQAPGAPPPGSSIPFTPENLPRRR
jgi:hypothetical protein